MVKKEKTKILIAIGTCITLLFVFFLTSHIQPQNSISFKTNLKSESPPPNLPLIKGEEKARLPDGQGESQAILEINNTKYETEINGITSVYGFMQKLRKEEKINFKDKTYSGMGKLIEEIDGIKNSGEKNWIYYVNGEKAEIGVSNYQIKIGDVVSWKYESDY